MAHAFPRAKSDPCLGSPQLPLWGHVHPLPIWQVPPDFTEHPSFQRKEGPIRLTGSMASAGAHGELDLSALPLHSCVLSHGDTSSDSAITWGQASSSIR